jgi:hypothetical protein
MTTTQQTNTSTEHITKQTVQTEHSSMMPKMSTRFTQLYDQVSRRLSRSLRITALSDTKQTVSSADAGSKDHSVVATLDDTCHLPPSQLDTEKPIKDELEKALLKLCGGNIDAVHTTTSDASNTLSSEPVVKDTSSISPGGDTACPGLSETETVSSDTSSGSPHSRQSPTTESKTVPLRARPATMYEDPRTLSARASVTSLPAAAATAQSASAVPARLRGVSPKRISLQLTGRADHTLNDDTASGTGGKSRTQDPLFVSAAQRRLLKRSSLKPRLVTDNSTAYMSDTEVLSTSERVRHSLSSRSSLNLWRLHRSSKRTGSVSYVSSALATECTDSETTHGPRRSASMPSDGRPTLAEAARSGGEQILDTGLASCFRTKFELRFSETRAEERERRHQHVANLLDRLEESRSASSSTSTGSVYANSKARSSATSITSWLKCHSNKHKGPEPETIRLTLTPSLIRGDDDPEYDDYGDENYDNDNDDAFYHETETDQPGSPSKSSFYGNKQSNSNTRHRSQSSADQMPFDSVSYLAMRQVYVCDTDDI